MEQELDLRVYLKILKRRYVQLLVPAVVVFAVVVAIAYLLPPIYQARATILVESQQIPIDLARPTVTANANERIKVIEQRLTTRDNLLEIVRKFNLYAGERSRWSPTEIVAATREAIHIEQIDVGRQRALTTIGFTISFDNGDPTVASRVANELVTLILQQNIQVRTTRAAETNRFFEQRVARLEQELVAMEARIVDFKNRNRDSLPETLAFRQTQTATAKAEIDDIDRKISELEAELQRWRQRLASDPEGAVLDTNASDPQLGRLRTELVQLRALYADSHPEVRKVMAQIAALEAASMAPSGQADVPPGDQPTGAPSTANNGSTNGQIGLLEAQLKLLNSQRAAAMERSATLEVAVARAPQVEFELAALNRDYDSRQLQYRDAQAKVAAAATGEQLEEDRQAERFEVIEQATVPTEPVKPDRPRIMLAGSFGGIAAAVGLVILLELLDKSIRSTADLERRLQIRPIATIPYVTTIAEQRAGSRRLRALLVSGVAVVVVALVVVQTLYLPLDYIAGRVLERLGL